MLNIRCRVRRARPYKNRAAFPAPAPSEPKRDMSDRSSFLRSLAGAGLRRRLAVLGTLAVLSGGAWYLLSPADEARTVYTFAAVEEGPIVSAVSTSGALRAAGEVVVGSQLSGQIAEVAVDYNSRVARGDVLARLDPRTFEARVAQAQAQLEVARARVAETEAARNRAAVQLADARRDFERRQALRKQGNLSERDFETARTRLDTAEADLRMADAQIMSARAGVLQQDAALKQAATDLERSVIRAPIDGVVIKREVEPGQTVQASMTAPTLFTIASSLERMEVEARVDEADIGRVREGQPVRFTVDAFPGTGFAGTVRQIRKAPKEQQNVVTYTVVVAADNPGERLLPGLTAKLDIVMGERERAVKIPAAALRFRPRPEARPGAARTPGAAVAAEQGPPAGPKRAPGEAAPAADGTRRGTVWVLGRGGAPEPVQVTLGLENADWTEMAAGPLKPGDQLIVRAERQGAAAPRPAGFRF